MKQNKFNDLPLQEKVLIISEYAEFLMTVEVIGYRIHLYSLNSHFVEAHHNLSTREVDKILITSYADLDRFLARVTVNYK